MVNTKQYKKFVPVKEGYKRCYGGCKQDKLIGEFYGIKTRRCKECLKKYLVKYRKNNRNKIKLNTFRHFEQFSARGAVRYALMSGILRKGACCLKDDTCSKRIEAHHYLGYDKKHYLDIKWCCTHHHRIIDGNCFGVVK